MLPKKGKDLHRRSTRVTRNGEFGQALAAALKSELGSTHQAVKTVMRWTGASERTVKHWFAGARSKRTTPRSLSTSFQRCFDLLSRHRP